MDIKKITEIVNTDLLPEDAKRHLILSQIAMDKDAIPDILLILNKERETKEEILTEINLNLSRSDQALF